MSWSIELVMPEATRQAITNCADRRGMGMAIARAMDRENELTVNRVKEKLSGEVLHVRSNLLRNSIERTDAVVLGSQVLSTIGSNVRTGGESVVYAHIHEFGGQTRPHLIVAKNGKALAFSMGGNTLIRRSVNHPGSKIPERSFLRSALTERKGRYETRLVQAAHKFLSGGKP